MVFLLHATSWYFQIQKSDSLGKSWRTQGPAREWSLFLYLYLELILPEMTIWDKTHWDSLVIQWLRFHTPNAGGLCSIPGQGTKSHMPQLKIPQVAPKTWCSKINKYFFNFTKGQSTLSSQNHFWISQPSSNEHLKVQPHPCWATSWFLLDVICEAVLLGWKTLRLEIGWSSWSWCRAKINIRLWHSEGLENWLSVASAVHIPRSCSGPDKQVTKLGFCSNFRSQSVFLSLVHPFSEFSCQPIASGQETLNRTNSKLAMPLAGHEPTFLDNLEWDTGTAEGPGSWYCGMRQGQTVTEVGCRSELWSFRDFQTSQGREQRCADRSRRERTKLHMRRWLNAGCVYMPVKISVTCCSRHLT